MRWGMVIGVMAVVAAACGYALWRDRPPDPITRLAFDQIELPAPPSYLPRDFRDQVRTLSGLPPVITVPEDGLPERLYRAFSAHPWVAEVRQVLMLPGPRLRVELTYRRPAATVLGVVVDDQGVVLPGKVEAMRLLEIRGLRGQPPSRPGRAWESPPLRAALHLAQVVAQDQERLDLAAIQVGSDPLDPDLRLITRAGGQVVWQRLAGPQPGEPSDEEKLKRLRSYRAEHGGLDRPAGPYLLDVRPRDAILRKPLRP